MNPREINKKIAEAMSRKYELLPGRSALKQWMCLLKVCQRRLGIIGQVSALKKTKGEIE